MKKTSYLLFVCFLVSIQIIAQTPGNIFDAATPTANPMDINGDGWITTSGTAFVSDDQA